MQVSAWETYYPTLYHWLLTGGGYGTNVLPVLTYQFAFRTNNFGKGAANAMIQLTILVIFLVLYLRIVMKGVEE